MAWVGSVAEMPVSGCPGQQGGSPFHGGTLGRKGGCQARVGGSSSLPGSGLAGGQAGGSFSSFLALVTTNANPVPAAPNGR